MHSCVGKSYVCNTRALAFFLYLLCVLSFGVACTMPLVRLEPCIARARINILALSMHMHVNMRACMCMRTYIARSQQSYACRCAYDRYHDMSLRVFQIITNSIENVHVRSKESSSKSSLSTSGVDNRARSAA